MRRLTAVLLSVVLLCTALPAAAEGRVTYQGNAGDIVFAPGSEFSLTDLFTDFKDIMPGDSRTQRVTLRNDADNEVKVKVYMRALGAHADSRDFLSQLQLTVSKTDDPAAYMFDATADATDGLADWVCLGMLYAGGEVDLDVTLTAPVTLTDAYSDQVGYLDWEFMVEEFPVEEDDPKAPGTGDTVVPWLTAVMALSAALLILLFILRRRQRS